MPLLKKQKQKELVVPLMLAVEILIVFILSFSGYKEIEVWRISSLLSISFSNDGLSRLYSCLISVIWFLAAVFSMEYMKHENHVERFFYVLYGVIRRAYGYFLFRQTL